MARDRDRDDGLSAEKWKEFEQLKFSKDEALLEEFHGDFDTYWAYLQNQHRARVVG